VQKGFGEGEVVFGHGMVNHRLVPNAMEPRGVLAHWEPGKDTMTIWSSTQNPHILKTMIAAMNGLGQHQVRAIAPDVGGGFGAKIGCYQEELLLGWLPSSPIPLPSFLALSDQGSVPPGGRREQSPYRTPHPKWIRSPGLHRPVVST